MALIDKILLAIERKCQKCEQIWWANDDGDCSSGNKKMKDFYCPLFPYRFGIIHKNKKPFNAIKAGIIKIKP